MQPRELLSEFQQIDKYARYLPEPGRRETWSEAVHRTLEWLNVNTAYSIPQSTRDKLWATMLNKTVLPSMRAMAMAGPAADKNHAHIYNCCFVAMDSLTAFSESVLLAMAGVGVAFSVERMHIDRLPVVNLQSGHVIRHTVGDSAEGWAEAMRVGVELWFAGHDVVYDFSNVRPAGAVLHTKGGRASGPGPLRELLNTTRAIILERQGKKLRPVDVYDIMCWTGWASVSGGVRHTAMLCLFDMDDQTMLTAKRGEYWKDEHARESKRGLANNSAAITKSLTYEQWRDFLLNGPLGATGEPNIFNRRTALKLLPDQRSLSAYQKQALGLNVCGEVFLAPQQFCNLTMLKLESGLSRAEIVKRVELSTVLGMLQAACVEFTGLRQEWRNNAIDDVLLGVSPTGWMECETARDPETMHAMRDAARKVANEYASILGINPPGAITSVKPSGNSSLLVDSSAGIHPDFYPYYLRRVTLQQTSPLLPVLRDAGVPLEQSLYNRHDYKAVFPVKGRGILRSELSALDQLNLHLSVREHYCEHNASQTVTFKTGEEYAIVEWMHSHQEEVAGVTFLRDDGNVYEQSPIEEISEERYEAMFKEFPTAIDWSILDEREDYTSAPVGCDGMVCSL